MVNNKTWYAHMFRGGGSLSFPYPLPRSQQVHAQAMVRELFFNNRWEKQVKPLSWLVEKFWPVPGWSDEDLAAIQAKAKVFRPTATKPNGNHPRERYSQLLDELHHIHQPTLVE